MQRGLHALELIAASAEQSHPGLGNMLAFAVLCVKARRTLLLIAPRGCGKSQVLECILANKEDALKIDKLSNAGLRQLQERLTNFHGLVSMDDLGRLTNDYMRINTLATMTELVYSHYATNYTAFGEMDIQAFYGGFIAGCQPVALKGVLQDDTWEATIEDKAVRYYHLYRPVQPSLASLSVSWDWGGEVDAVEMPDMSDAAFSGVMSAASRHWSKGRALEHSSWLLRAAAALEGRNEVLETDAAIVACLMRPLLAEEFVVERPELEGKRFFSPDAIYLMMEFLTYGRIHLGHLVRDFRVSESTAYKIMERNKHMWDIVSKQPTIYAPSDWLRNVFSEIAVCKGD